MANHYHKFDLPADLKLKGDIAIDTEAMGLQYHRDRLCVVQVSDGNGEAHLVHFPQPNYEAPNLKRFLSDESRVKIFHFARFDLAMIDYYLGITINNVYCTKTASRLARTYTNAHSLKELCSEILGIKISKQQQTSDWGAAELSNEQISYAAADVLYLHGLRTTLDEMLARENRKDLAQECFKFLPTRAKLDLLGWGDMDIFAHTI
jgi:ribonuclease D